jgi:hypothetical protein
MSNPSGDSTIHDLPFAANPNGSEEFVVDQVQGSLRVTVKFPISNLSSFGIVGVSYGTTAQRPASPVAGQPYFDTTLGFQINWNPVHNYWVSASGFGPV